MQLSLPVILFVVFLVLKLTEVIAWSWWWVTAPLWIPAALIVVALGIMAMIYATTRNNFLKNNRRF